MRDKFMKKKTNERKYVFFSALIVVYGEICHWWNLTSCKAAYLRLYIICESPPLYPPVERGGTMSNER